MTGLWIVHFNQRKTIEMQIYTLHGQFFILKIRPNLHLDGQFFSYLLCMYLLMKTKDEKSYPEAFGQLKDIIN